MSAGQPSSTGPLFSATTSFRQQQLSNMSAGQPSSTDGSSLCLQCDAIVHVGGSKQTHERYVLLKQRVECIEKVGPSEDLSSQCTEQNGITHQTLSFGNINEKLDGYKVSPVTISELHINLDEHNSAKIDLNVIPHRIQGDVTNCRQFATWLSLMDISRESTQIV